jgi:ribonuclease VapC
MSEPAIFVDASALCAILAVEDDAKALLDRLQAAERRMTSPLAIWETVTSLQRLVGRSHEETERGVQSFMSLMGIAVLSIEPEMTALALDAFRRYGKSRHPAALNFGDCFAYACAKHHKVPLLCKGNDFAQTDVEIA